MDSKTLECKNNRSKTSSLYLWHCIFRHAFLPKFLIVDSEALPWWGSSRSSCTLLSFASAQWHQQNIRTQWEFHYTKHSGRSQSQSPHSWLEHYILEPCSFITHFDIGTTSRTSRPTRELWFNCFTNPLSTIYLQLKKQNQKFIWLVGQVSHHF